MIETKQTYTDKWLAAKEAIFKLPSGTFFKLSDIVLLPPASLGVRLYRSQQELGILIQGKDINKVNFYIKL